MEYKTTNKWRCPGRLENYKHYNMDGIKIKYNMNFNVLVVDCEGALYYMLKDEPEFLNGFETIIIENDFTDINIKNL